MMLRNILTLFVLAVLAPGLVHAQSFELYGSAGPTITDSGYSVAAGAGFSPGSRVTFLFSVERTHLSSQTKRTEGAISSFRGGTLLVGAAELRIAPLGRNRLGPFGLAGVAIGRSRPNVNATFPDRITNDVRAVFFGGGLNVPLSERLTAFADLRMMLGAEGLEGIVAVAPLRAGVSWRF